MKHLFIESLRQYVLTREEKSKILAMDGRLNHDTDGEEDCYILDPTTKRYKKKDTPACL